MDLNLALDGEVVADRDRFFLEDNEENAQME